MNRDELNSRPLNVRLIVFFFLDLSKQVFLKLRRRNFALTDNLCRGYDFKTIERNIADILNIRRKRFKQRIQITRERENIRVQLIYFFQSKTILHLTETRGK